MSERVLELSGIKRLELSVGLCNHCVHHTMTLYRAGAHLGSTIHTTDLRCRYRLRCDYAAAQAYLTIVDDQ